MANMNELSKEDKERALALLLREKENKAKEKARMSDPTYKAKVQEASRKATAKTAILVAKAKAAGITVTDKEVDDYLASKAKK